MKEEETEKGNKKVLQKWVKLTSMPFLIVAFIYIENELVKSGYISGLFLMLSVWGVTLLCILNILKK
jgi:hypothetical protein